MRGFFIGYKGGKHTQCNKYALIKVGEVENKSGAGLYIRRKVIWISPKGSRLTGNIVGIHGRMRAR